MSKLTTGDKIQLAVAFMLAGGVVGFPNLVTVGIGRSVFAFGIFMGARVFWAHLEFFQRMCSCSLGLVLLELLLVRDVMKQNEFPAVIIAPVIPEPSTTKPPSATAPPVPPKAKATGQPPVVSQDLIVTEFDSVRGITITNPNSSKAYVMDLVSTWGTADSTTFRIDLLVERNETKFYPFDSPSINWHTLDQVGATYDEQRRIAGETYGNRCITAILYSKSDPAYEQINRFYSVQGRIAGLYPATATLRYRINDSKNAVTKQDVPIAVAVMRRDDCKKEQ